MTRVAWRPANASPAIASTRIRCLVPCAELARAGWRSELADGADHDVVIFVKAYAEADIRLAGELRERGVRTVFDLCDNHFHVPADRPDLAERAERLRRMIAAVDAVSVSTPWLGRLVEHDRVHVVDDALDPTTERPHGGLRPALAAARERLRGRGDRARLAWFGNAGSASPRFGMVDLAAIGPELERLAARLPLEVSVMSNDRAAYRELIAPLGVRSHYLRWSEATFARAFRTADVCLIPVTQNDFTCAKTSNRVITALRLGVPVVAGRIPSYEDFAGVIRFEDWEDNVAAYATDSELAARDVRAGQELIRSTYTPEHLVGQWSAVIEAATR